MYSPFCMIFLSERSVDFLLFAFRSIYLTCLSRDDGVKVRLAFIAFLIIYRIRHIYYAFWLGVGIYYAKYDMWQKSVFLGIFSYVSNKVTKFMIVKKNILRIFWVLKSIMTIIDLYEYYSLIFILCYFTT